MDMGWTDEEETSSGWTGWKLAESHHAGTTDSKRREEPEMQQDTQREMTENKTKGES